MKQIAIIDDDVYIGDMLSELLGREGYGVLRAYSGTEALLLLSGRRPDLVLLDLMLPGLSGQEVLPHLAGIPVIVLSARGDVEEKVRLLLDGAADYLTKPFDTRELLACVGALLRRQGGQTDAMRFGNTTLDLASGTLECGEANVRLSAREFDVMRLLFQTQGRNLSKEAILARVWGYDSNAVENHVEVYVGFLRKKLASIGSNVRIEAARRLGYHLEEDKGC